MNPPFSRLARMAVAAVLPVTLPQCSLLKRELSAAPSRTVTRGGLLAELAARSREARPPFQPTTVAYQPSEPAARAARHRHRGEASYYRVRTNGTRTASGIPLKDSVSTAAHRHLPFGSIVRVTNLRNGRSDVVKITDRGPFVRGRIIDVSYAAAQRLGMVQSGIAPVEIEILHRPGAI